MLPIGQRWAAVAALDGQIPAAAQLAMFAELARSTRGATYWLARRAGRKGSSPLLGRAIKRTGAGRAGSPIRQLIEAYGPAITALIEVGPSILSPVQSMAVEHRAKSFVDLGAPADLAAAVASIRPLINAADIGDLASVADRPPVTVARVYHQVGAAFGFDRAREAAGELGDSDEFERLALRRLVEDTFQEQSALTRSILKDARSIRTHEDAHALVGAWSADHAVQAAAVRAAIEAIEAAGEPWSFAKLTIVNVALRELVATAR
jgi:glutamate dehydrogenase